MLARNFAANTRYLRLICSAQQSKARPTPGSDPRLAGPSAGGGATSDNGAEPEVKQLQDADVEGVARVDTWQSDPGRVQLLAAGDAAALLLFAAAGRANHGELLGLELLTTALPFWAGWFATGPLLGAYGRDAQDGRPVPAALAAAKTWAVATPVSLALRGLLKGYVPPTPFIVVSFVATGTLMIGWRMGLAAATKPWVRPVPARSAC